MKSLILLLAVAAVPALQQKGPPPQVLQGKLRYLKQLEGGVWTLAVGKTVYDLHGDLKGFADGDEAEIQGIVEKDKACIHMVGIIFRVDSIRKKAGSG